MSLVQMSHYRSPPVAASLLPVTGGRRGDYALGDVARHLRIEMLTRASIIARLRLLAVGEQMPLPRNPRQWGKVIVSGPSSICAASIWDAGEFDAWLARRHPRSPAAAAIDSAVLRAQLAARAADLAGGAA